MKVIKILKVISLSILLYFNCLAQQPVDTSIAMYIDLNEVVIRDENFDIKKFIDIIQKDESFQKAFHNIRSISYSADNSIKLYDKKHVIKASYKSKTKQTYQDKCRSMIVENEVVSGDFYDKNKDYNYYTAELYDRLFFTKGIICNNSKDAQKQQYGDKKSRVDQLKTLLFKPGQEVSGIPFVGSKTAIFNKKMAKYYDYQVSSGSFDGHDSYIFTVKVKPEYQNRQKDETIIKSMETYFDKDNWQVLSRNYELVYDGFAFSFDVNMNVEIKKVGNLYVPVFITYKGVWDIPFRKPEDAVFQIFFDY